MELPKAGYSSTGQPTNASKNYRIQKWKVQKYKKFKKDKKTNIHQQKLYLPKAGYTSTSQPNKHIKCTQIKRQKCKQTKIQKDKKILYLELPKAWYASAHPKIQKYRYENTNI